MHLLAAFVKPKRDQESNNESPNMIKKNKKYDKPSGPIRNIYKKNLHYKNIIMKTLRYGIMQDF